MGATTRNAERMHDDHVPFFMASSEPWPALRGPDDSPDQGQWPQHAAACSEIMQLMALAGCLHACKDGGSALMHAWSIQMTPRWQSGLHTYSAAAATLQRMVVIIQPMLGLCSVAGEALWVLARVIICIIASWPGRGR